MYKYKIDVMEALKARGYNSYILRENKTLSQGTITKIKNEGNITLKTLNAVCLMLKCQISDIVEIVPTDDEKIKYY